MALNRSSNHRSGSDDNVRGLLPVVGKSVPHHDGMAR